MLSNRIYTLRRRSGLSQDQLAELLGVSRQAVSRWENGSATPGLEKLQAMCRCFQVTMDQLTGAEEVPPPPLLPPRETLTRRSCLGAALCAGGALGVLGLGTAMLLRPDFMAAADASSMVTLNGSGLLLLLLLLIMGAGAILVLRDRRK